MLDFSWFTVRSRWRDQLVLQSGWSMKRYKRWLADAPRRQFGR